MAFGATPRPLTRSRSTGTWGGIHWRDLDWAMLGAVILIAILGLAMVYSATRNLVDDPYYFVKRQAAAMIVGVGVFLVILRIDYRKFRDFSLLAYLVVIALLFFVLTPVG